MTGQKQLQLVVALDEDLVAEMAADRAAYDKVAPQLLERFERRLRAEVAKYTNG